MHSTSTSGARRAVDVGILVADMARSLAFYRDLIGLAVVGEHRTSLIGGGRLVQLQHGASLIKLLEMDGTPVGRSPAGLTSALGLRYLTLLVADIKEIMTKLSDAQVTVAIPITQLGNGAQIAMVEDPDGNVIEFVQEAGG